jgi:acetyltransferase
MNTAKVEALLNPTSVAILGARENPTGWTARIFGTLQRFNFPGPVYPVNPRHDEIWGAPCYAGLADLPTVPDHLVVMRAAATVPAILREAAAMGTRSATVYAAGFSEMATEEGRKLEAELLEVLDETGIAISGPNCLGNLSARARLLTLPDDRMRDLVPGPVAMVGQSGTTTPGIARTLIDRGIDVGYIVTSGNETGLAAADYIDYFVTDPDVRLIFCLIEAVRRPQDFLSACRRARDAGKPVVALKMGISDGGRVATLAHTGSLAGAVEAFDAVAGEAGVIRVQSADEAINRMEFLVLADLPPLDGVGVLVNSGGIRGLSVDAADRHNVPVPAFAPETLSKMKALMGEGTRISNPLDAAQFLNQPTETVLDLIDIIRSDPAVGMVLYQEDLPPSEGLNDANKRRANRVLGVMQGIEARFLKDGGKPIALTSPTSYDLTEFSREARKQFPHLVVLNEPERAFRTIRTVLDYRDRKLAGSVTPDRSPASSTPPELERIRAISKAATESVALSEPESKALLRCYDIPLPQEGVAASAEEAASIATSIGYPVVVKAVASTLTHKSDAGAVQLGLDNADSVKQACATIAKNVAAYDAAIELEGWLVAQAVPAGLELVIGIQNDAEMGSVIMFGTGGIWLELVKDVAFAAPGIDHAGAERLIAKTRANTLLNGYRGEGPYDRTAVVDALVAVGRLAAEAGDALETLDINPFVALPVGQGAFALDALAIAKPYGVR